MGGWKGGAERQGRKGAGERVVWEGGGWGGVLGGRIGGGVGRGGGYKRGVGRGGGWSDPTFFLSPKRGESGKVWEEVDLGDEATRLAKGRVRGQSKEKGRYHAQSLRRKERGEKTSSREKRTKSAKAERRSRKSLRGSEKSMEPKRCRTGRETGLTRITTHQYKRKQVQVFRMIESLRGGRNWRTRALRTLILRYAQAEE